jgi:uncharacterized protein (DUF2267 family)
MIERGELTRLLREHFGDEAFPDEVSAERAVVATLGGLGRALTADECELLAKSLPHAWAGQVREASHGAVPDRDELVDAVASRLGMPAGAAWELVTAVTWALAKVLDEETRSRLDRALGPSLPLFSSTAEGRPGARPHAQPAAARSTLAEGRPGSSHPLSEAAPKGAHTHSVAAANPHGDSKLSSAEGLTQEALGETLSSGKPGPKRSLSEG